MPEIPTWVEMARALGANPTPIPAAEIYTALQTGVVDAIEVPADFITSSKIYEVAQHATRTHHIFTEVSMFASAQRDGLADARAAEAIRDAARQAVQVEMWDTNLTVAGGLERAGGPDHGHRRPRRHRLPRADAPGDRGLRPSAGPKGKEYIDAVRAVA